MGWMGWVAWMGWVGWVGWMGSVAWIDEQVCSMGTYRPLDVFLSEVPMRSLGARHKVRVDDHEVGPFRGLLAGALERVHRARYG